MRDFKLTSDDKKFILFFAGLTFIYVLPMLIANCPYNDDYCRILTGNSWDDDGRLLPSAIIRFLVHSTTIYDPAPLPLILSIPIFTLGGFLIKKSFIDVDSPYISAVLAFGFIINPFLSRLFVYQLDSLGLAISLVLLIIPFALNIPEKNRKRISYHAVCALCIFLSMNSYQASLGFFMALAVIELVYKAYKKEYQGLLKNLLSRVLQFGLGFIAYKLFLKLFFIANIARRAAKSKTLEISSDGLEVFLNNCQTIVLSIVDSLSQSQIFFLSILIVLSIIFTILTYKNSFKAKTSAADKAALALITVSPLIIFSFSFIHIAAIRESFTSSVQVLTSFSGLTAFLLLVPAWAIKNKKMLCCLLAPVILSAFGFNYIVGNLVKIENDFQQPIISSIVMKINDSNPDNKTKLYYSGRLPRSEYFNRMTEIFPMMNTLYTNEPWAFKYQLPYYGCGVKNYRDIVNEPLNEKISLADSQIIDDSFYYKLYKHNKDLVLIFK